MRNLATILLCLMLCATAFGATRYVSPTGSATSPYDTWAKAATGLTQVVAGSVDGDTVMVTNGTYSRWSGDVATNLIWVSVNGPASTIIDCTPFTTYCGWWRGGSMYGFTVQNFTGDYGGVLFGGANFAHIVSNCIFRKSTNTKAGQGAITFYASTGYVYNCQIVNNSCSVNGAGIGATADVGGTVVYVKDSTISNNTTSGDGGGACCGAGSMYFDSCVFTHNTAHEGGAAYRYPTATLLSISNSVIKYNGSPAAYPGGTMYCKVYNSIYFGNWGAIISASAEDELRNCTFVGNYEGNANYGTIYASHSENCIAYYNYPADLSSGWYTNFCYRKITVSEPPATRANCITNPPVFVDDYATALATPSAANCGTGFVLLTSGLDGLSIQSTSPCIGLGTNSAWMSGAYDFGGVNPRIYGASVDMGAYEYSPTAPPAGGGQRWRGIILE